MKKIVFSILAYFMIGNLHADEGMWLLNMLERLNLQQKGLKLTNEQIYTINESCLKDAVIGLGSEGSPFRFMCTAELVSAKGLVFTNHHCGYEYIQNHSSVDHNYLEDGFWANSYEEELPNDGATASIMVRMEDVSDFILSDVADSMTIADRNKIIDSLETILVDSINKTEDLDASVKAMFEGNQYILFVYKIFKDLRLVGAPPSSIGKFGGDTDNWMWPRHTGDFCVLRIYADKEGNPAPYSEENVPYEPDYYFPVSTKGVKNNDFTMIMGFPGSTDRYLTSYEIDEVVNRSNIDRIKVRTQKLDIIDDFMNKEDSLRISYASKRARISNYWKYFQGQNKSVRQNKVIEKQQAFEDEFVLWLKNNNKDTMFLEDIRTATANTLGQNIAIDYYMETVFFGPDFLYFVYKLHRHLTAIQTNKDSSELVAKEKGEMLKLTELFFQNYNKEVDKALMSEMFQVLYNEVDHVFLPEKFTSYGNKKAGNFTGYVQKLFKKSKISDENILVSYINNDEYESIKSDILYKEMLSLLGKYRSAFASAKNEFRKLDSAKMLYQKLLMEYNPKIIAYPDANSTLRYTYGYVKDYDPMDAVHYDYSTYADGILEKYNPDDREFIVPEKLIELIENKDFGAYAESRKLPICFISTNDITGGNSGSPVLNNKGELVGIAFDGNWEAMSGDISFEEEKQRTISVDIRYVLFVIDKYAGAKRLIEELTLK